MMRSWLDVPKATTLATYFLYHTHGLLRDLGYRPERAEDLYEELVAHFELQDQPEAEKHRAIVLSWLTGRRKAIVASIGQNTKETQLAFLLTGLLCFFEQIRFKDSWSTWRKVKKRKAKEEEEEERQLRAEAAREAEAARRELAAVEREEEEEKAAAQRARASAGVRVRERPRTPGPGQRPITMDRETRQRARRDSIARKQREPAQPPRKVQPAVPGQSLVEELKARMAVM